MEKILSIGLLLTLLSGAVWAAEQKEQGRHMSEIKKKSWGVVVSKRNFESGPKKKGVNLPYPPGQVQLDAQEAEDF